MNVIIGCILLIAGLIIMMMSLKWTETEEGAVVVGFVGSITIFGAILVLMKAVS